MVPLFCFRRVKLKVKMKLKKNHPNGVMHFGRHAIQREFKEFELNESEIKDLKNEGPKYWFMVELIEEKRRRGRPSNK